MPETQNSSYGLADIALRSSVIECVCKLLVCYVISGQVVPLMEAVLKLVKKKPPDLPTKSTVNEWNVMRRILAQ